MSLLPKKIFVADDDRDILHVLKLMLETEDYIVETTTDANEIFTYKENLPDLILLDIWMSGIDGREICKRLKQNKLTENIPVVFLSANAQLDEITNKYSATDFIAKPFEMKNFLTKIRSILLAAEEIN